MPAVADNPDFDDAVSRWDAWRNRVTGHSGLAAPTPEAFAAMFVCKRCERPLALERVVELARDDENPRQVSILHWCVCSIAIMVQNVVATLPAITALFGRKVPLLPYESPFIYRTDADVEADPLLTRWAWELSQCPDVDDFLLFTSAQSRANELYRYYFGDD